MNHPTSQLAAYVDGSLAPSERELVDSHLRSCETCRDEVTSATEARRALRTLAGVVAPSHIGSDAIALAAGRAASTPGTVRALRGAPNPVWSRVAAIAGVAAAIALLAGVVLPSLGDLPAGGGRTAAMDAVSNLPPATAVEVVDQDLDVDAIQALALGYRDAAAGVESTTSEAGPAGLVVTDTKASPGEVEKAISCLTRAFGPLPAPPARLVQARYQEAPAIIGVVLTGPGNEEPPDTVEIFVASLTDCAVISSTRAPL
jgi:hypothetical protein